MNSHIERLSLLIGKMRDLSLIPVFLKGIKSMAEKNGNHYCAVLHGIYFIVSLLLGMTPLSVAASETQIFSGWNGPGSASRFGSAEAACKAHPALNYVYDPEIHSAYYSFAGIRPNAMYPAFRDCLFDYINPVNPAYNSAVALWLITVQPTQIDIPSTDCPTGSRYCKQSGPTCPATQKPISIGTGNKFLSETNDLSTIVDFRRYFNSANTNLASNAMIAAGTMPLGVGWTFSYQQRIRVPLGAATVAWAIRPDGRIYTYHTAGSGWTTDVDVLDQLNELKDSSGIRTGWRYVDVGGKKSEIYDATGFLQSVVNISGMQTTVIYSDGTDGSVSGRGGFFLDVNGVPITQQTLPPGLLLRVQDAFGHILHFGYDNSTHIVMISNQGSSATDKLRYTYDSIGHLSNVKYPDGTAKTYLYGEAAYTSGASLPNTLTGIVDQNGTRVISYTYDASGKAIGEMQAGAVGSNQLTFTLDATGSVIGTAVMDATGFLRTYGFINQLGVSRLTSVSQPAASGCSASTSAMTYDANGNLASADDFNAHRTCYLSDLTRNLETTRVEGLPNIQACSTVTPPNATLPTNSRKTSTRWHPDWRLAIKVAEPGKITTSVYNGQPDPFNGNALASCAPASALLPDGKPIAVLCRQVEQATTDADGHLGFGTTLQAGVPKREQTWTYNAFGQVLTHDGPRTDVADTTTFVYYADTTADHTRGDLQRVTNALGQITNYTKYNLHGQLLQSTDPNGITTTHTYDLRQRLLSTSVAAQTTSYAYDPVGQLTRITQPDASWIGYAYEPAHRLIAVTDNQGNRIDYTLDNAGSRIAENTKDPSGTLKRALSRSLDALGRVQQTTGRE